MVDKFLLWWGSADKNSYELVQTISHNIQYKIEKTHFNFDRHILCIPIY